MKIWANCRCCVKRTTLVSDYEIGGAFNKKTEFGIKLFKNLKEHLLNLQEDLKSQGHYERIFITPDAFTNEIEKITQEILDLFLPEEKKTRPKIEKKKEREKQFDFDGWELEQQQGKKGITSEEKQQLVTLKGVEGAKQQWTWEEIQYMLNPEVADKPDDWDKYG